MKPKNEEDVGQPRPLVVQPRHVLRVYKFWFRRHFMGDAIMTLTRYSKMAGKQLPAVQVLKAVCKHS